MVFGPGSELGRGQAVEHGTSRAGRWLRARRLKIALAIAAIEGILVVAHVIPRVAAIVVAAVLMALYFGVRRRIGWDSARQASWIAATSQVLVVLVPILVFIVGTLALVAVAALAVAALVVLFADRK